MKLRDLVKAADSDHEVTTDTVARRPCPGLNAEASPDPRWLVVRSRLLDGERILIVLEKKHLKEAKNAHPGKVIYFPAEIDELRRHKGTPGFPEFLRNVHLVKKRFRGWVIPSTTQKGGDGRGTTTCGKRTGRSERGEDPSRGRRH